MHSRKAQKPGHYQTGLLPFRGRRASGFRTPRGSGASAESHWLGRNAREWKDWNSDDTVIPDLPELRRTDSVPDTSRVIASLLTQLEDRRVTCATWLGHSGGAPSRSKLHIGTLERVERLIIVAAAPSARVLENVRCPILVVLGALDELAVPARPRVQIEVIAGVGHDPPRPVASTNRALDQRLGEYVNGGGLIMRAFVSALR